MATLQGAALKSRERPSWPQEMHGHRERTEEGRAVAAFSADTLRTGGRELEQTVSSDRASDLRQEPSLPQTSCVTGNAQTLGRDGEGCSGLPPRAASFYLLSTGVPGALQLPPRPSCGVPRPCPHFSAQVLRLCLGARRRCEHKPIRYTWQAYTRCPIPATTGPPDTATTVDL
uniref:Uncharacterized protein n=1 Tax=Theropithecus gelada TaxID=9565 RepID=A0A8D2K1C5_THEGE